MATIDSNIAMGYRPIQIENPLNQLAAVSQIQANQQGQQLNALKIKETERELGENEEIRNYLAGANLNTPEGRAGLRRFGKTGLAYEKILAEQEKTGLERTKLSGEISKQQTERNNQRLRDLSRNPSNANIQAHFEDFELDNPNDVRKIEDARRRRDYLLSADIPTRNAYLSSIGATAGELKPVIKDRDIGGSIIPTVLDAYSGLPISTGQPIVKTPTIADKISQGNLNVSQQRLAAELNPDIQGNLAAAKKRAEENVKFETQGRIDIAANRKALKQAGYDPVTGEDDITKLIKESTGGYLGKGLDIGARVFGSATEGSKALAQLEQKGNAITFGLLNGKLGAGISTSDRQFIEALVSRISDGTLPVEDRLAAWTSAKDMMRTLGMVEPPTKSGSPKPSAAAPTNTGEAPSLSEIFNPKPKTK